MLLTLENEWSAKTEEMKNAGRSAVWSDITDMELPVTTDILKYKRITVTVLDKNTFKNDSWMGKGDFSLRKLGSHSGAPLLVTHTVRLKDKRGRSAGKVLVEAEIQPLLDIVASSAGAAGAALQAPGMVSFLDCSVSKVAETAMMGKQDPDQVKKRSVDTISIFFLYFPRCDVSNWCMMQHVVLHYIILTVYR